MSNLPTIPTTQEFGTMKELGKMAIASGFLPQSIKTPEQAIIVMLKGRELGIPPMQAFSGIAVIQGKPTVGPELMLALIYKNCPGAVVNFIATDNAKCVIQAKRPGGAFSEFSFTMDDARRANLLDKGPWKSFPAAMLRARCISAMARAVFPDAISGVSYTPEELGASVDEEGNVLSLPEVGKPDDQPKALQAREVIDAQPPKVVIEQRPRPVQSMSAGTIQPGDFRINFGTTERGYLGMTIAEAVERDGLPRVQLYINRLVENCAKEGKHVHKFYSDMRERLAEYTHTLERRKAEQDAFANEPMPEF